MKFLKTLFEGLEGDGANTFPCCSTDLLTLLGDGENSSVTGSNVVPLRRVSVKLLSSRMQVSFSNVSLEISTGTKC